MGSINSIIHWQFSLFGGGGKLKTIVKTSSLWNSSWRHLDQRDLLAVKVFFLTYWTLPRVWHLWIYLAVHQKAWNPSEYFYNHRIKLLKEWFLRNSCFFMIQETITSKVHPRDAKTIFWQDWARWGNGHGITNQESLILWRRIRLQVLSSCREKRIFRKWLWK